MSEREAFAMLDGQTVERITFSNGRVRVRLLSYGGIIQSIGVPVRNGRLANNTLGFAGLEDYIERSPFSGATIGRPGEPFASTTVFRFSTIACARLRCPSVRSGYHGDVLAEQPVAGTSRSASVTGLPCIHDHKSARGDVRRLRRTASGVQAEHGLVVTTRAHDGSLYWHFVWRRLRHPSAIP